MTITSSLVANRIRSLTDVATSDRADDALLDGFCRLQQSADLPASKWHLVSELRREETINSTSHMTSAHISA
jgi:hypothetical protein